MGGMVLAPLKPRRVVPQAEDSEIFEAVRSSQLWELLTAFGTVIAIGFVTWLVTRVLARWLSGKTRFGLRNLKGLAAPVTALVSVIVTLLIVRSAARELRVITGLLELASSLVGLWLAARVLDVIWATSVASARLRTRYRIGTLLLAGRHVGKLLLGLAGIGVIAVQLGAGDRLYVIIAAAAAGLAFAARDPLRSAVAFVSMAIDPPFHVGDRVRISDFRSGESSVGTITDISLSSITIETRQHTHVVIANVMLPQLRIENLSAADRRRLELEVPAAGLGTEAIRNAVAAIDRDLREHPGIAPEPTPRVWLGGAADGLRVKASLWLRRAADRREVQHDVLLKMHERLAV